MLLQFKVKNFKCFYDEMVLDMMATKEKRHLEATSEVNGNNILPLVAIHGANASGKTTLLEAINYMFKFIRFSNTIDINKELPIYPYLFSKKSLKENSEFEVSICLGGNEYRYGFSLNKNRIDEEWLYTKKFSLNTTAKQKMIFERYKDEVEFGKLLIFAIVAIKEEKGILRDLFNYINKFDFKIESAFIKNSVDILSDSNIVYNKFQKIINEFDPCLLGINIDLIEVDGEKKYNVSGIHKNLDDPDNDILLPLMNESNGTIRIFNIIPSILNNLENGGLLCIDEIDVKLHPLLFRKIVSMYMDKKINKNNAQLIYTAHSTFLFNSNSLRRDQLYLTDKDDYGKSKLYSLSEFRNLRVDADYEKKYLSGQFGGIPYNN